jgi:hypothetical protein
VVEADPRSMLVLVAYSSSQLNFSSNTLPLSFANASRLMREQTDQTDALVLWWLSRSMRSYHLLAMLVPR